MLREIIQTKKVRKKKNVWRNKQIKLVIITGIMILNVKMFCTYQAKNGFPLFKNISTEKCYHSKCMKESRNTDKLSPMR